MGSAARIAEQMNNNDEIERRQREQQDRALFDIGASIMEFSGGFNPVSPN